VITRRDETGAAISSVSATWLQADMIESLRLQPGAIVFEAGSGGYNAELIAHVAGTEGRVVTVDIDPWVVRRTRRFTTEAGSGRVTVVETDAALGAPAHLVPRGGFDGSLITYNCWDIAPAWREQLAEGRRLVLPLEIGGYTRAITLERRGHVLHARHFTYCGFVRDQGQQARTVPVAGLLDGELTLRFENGIAAPTAGLEEALRGPRHKLATSVTMGAGAYFGSLQLYAATTLPTFCRLAAHQDTGVTGIVKDRDTPAILGDGSLAYLTHVQTRYGERPEDKKWEWFVHAFGEQGPQLAFPAQARSILHHALSTADQLTSLFPYPRSQEHTATALRLLARVGDRSSLDLLAPYRDNPAFASTAADIIRTINNRNVGKTRS
jgi:protein-L-isoaspartate(D-aspartate) O-methyltransferase